MRMVSTALSMGQMWLRSGVSIIWRERLARAVTERHLADNNFYVMKHIDKRITDADTRITQELARVVMNMNWIVRKIVRPIMDTIYCTMLLIRIKMPIAGLAAMWGYGLVGLGLIQLMAPDFAHFEVEDQRLVASYRSAHDRVTDNSEAIAFLNGGRREEAIANEANARVLQQLNKKNNQRSV